MHSKHVIENSGECGNNDNDGGVGGGDDDDVVVVKTSANSDNADMDLEIKTDDVPDQTDSRTNLDNSLGANDNETKVHDLTSNNTTENDENQTSTNTFSDSEFIRKQWHRRLRTPVWARCSI